MARTESQGGMHLIAGSASSIGNAGDIPELLVCQSAARKGQNGAARFDAPAVLHEAVAAGLSPFDITPAMQVHLPLLVRNDTVHKFHHERRHHAADDQDRNQLAEDHDRHRMPNDVDRHHVADDADRQQVADDEDLDQEDDTPIEIPKRSTARTDDDQSKILNGPPARTSRRAGPGLYSRRSGSSAAATAGVANFIATDSPIQAEVVTTGELMYDPTSKTVVQQRTVQVPPRTLANPGWWLPVASPAKTAAAQPSEQPTVAAADAAEPNEEPAIVAAADDVEPSDGPADAADAPPQLTQRPVSSSEEEPRAEPSEEPRHEPEEEPTAADPAAPEAPQRPVKSNEEPSKEPAVAPLAAPQPTQKQHR